MKTTTLKLILTVLGGVFLGLGFCFLYTLRFHTYLGDDPSACMNCHIMAPYYSSWMHSSHGRDATCNDCHVPHENMVRKWAFKGFDGMKHVAKFVASAEKDVVRAEDMSSTVIMDNCIRCHEQLNNEFVKTGRIGFMKTKVGEGKACWDCHREIPHTRSSSLASTPNALVPYPPTPVPEWLTNAINNK